MPKRALSGEVSSLSSKKIGSVPVFLTAEVRRRGLELAALDARDELGELHMARCCHAHFGALAGDVAVHLLDLGAPALEDVLRHRGPLDVRARVLAGLRNEHALDGGERL